MTSTQAIMGSPRYMSPEQMRSTRTVDARADIWAIGVILYELTCGVPPFNGETMTELCAQILQDVPVPLARTLPSVPPGLDAVVQSCLAKNPEERPASLAELAVAIAEFGSQSGRGPRSGSCACCRREARRRPGLRARGRAAPGRAGRS